MESVGYHQFSSSQQETPEMHLKAEPPSTTNRRNWRIYIMLGVLALFLFLLTLTVGIKFSQVNQQVSDALISLQTIGASITVSQKGSLHAGPTVSLPGRGLCLKDWFFYKDKCYFISTERMNWNNAEKKCTEKKSHLLVVNDQEELEFVSQLLEWQTSYWIGLVERDEEGNWSWVDGTDFKSTEHFWDEEQPDDWDVRVNGEDCGQIHAQQVPDISSLRRWNDADCTMFYKFICEGIP
ncbi:hepatic lectin-like [Trichomycterus rosablanca]|uniref:hepatic lectin-like n=1 Tax=Trichomycterus rosablanca TaxID=2290929 RepID=UPI002F351075